MGQFVGIHTNAVEKDVQVTAQLPFSPKKPRFQPGKTTDQHRHALTDRATADTVSACTLRKLPQERRYIDFNTRQNNLVSYLMHILETYRESIEYVKEIGSETERTGPQRKAFILKLPWSPLLPEVIIEKHHELQ